MSLDCTNSEEIDSFLINLEGIMIQHNFIEENTTLSDVPCEKEGVNLLLGDNCWLDFIRLSSDKG